MKTLKEEYDDFQTCITRYFEEVVPEVNRMLSEGLAVGGNAQRCRESETLRIEMAFRVLRIDAPGYLKMKKGPEILNDFVHALLKQLTAKMHYPSILSCSASPVVTLDKKYVMSWFLYAKNEPAVTLPEGQCPKSLH
ncbi:TPA: hypothetical protein JD836_14710 [Citrobacter freundii]|nr:hypothetical protein [Citrobacter freundii]HCD1268050.1 hypothetical protein [Citrobacter freundii]